MGALNSPKESEADARDMVKDLIEKHGNSVYKFCRSLACSKEDADDLFQDAFLRVLEQPSKASANPQGYLFSAALYIWKSRKRTFARRNRIAPCYPLDDTIASGGDFVNNMIEREEVEMVRGLIERLPEKLRIPVILRYTMEMSVRDIALTMKLPAGTVMSRLFNARKAIQKGLVKFDET